QIRWMLSKREDEDIHVARRASEAPQPGEFSREMLHRSSRKDLPDLAEERASPTDGHAEVVEELRVEVRAETGLVRHDDAEKRQLNLPHARFGADRWNNVEPTQRGIAWLRCADGPQQHSLDADRAWLDARAALDQRYESLVLVLEATQARHRDGRWELVPVLAGQRQSSAARLDPHARDCLGSVIQDIEQRAVALGLGLRDQPAHAHDRRQQLLQRTVRQIPGEVHWVICPDFETVAFTAGLPGPRHGAVDAARCETRAGTRHP